MSQTNPAPQTTAQGELANFAAFEVGDQNYSSIDYMEPIPGSEQSNLGTYLAAPEPMTDSPSTDDIPSQNYTDSSLDTGPIITELESNFNQYTVHQEVGLDTVTTGGTLGGLYAKVYDPFGNQYEGVDNDTVTAFENAYIEARRISANRETAYQDAAIGGIIGFGLGEGFGLAIQAAKPLVASAGRNLFGSVKGIFRSGDEVAPNKIGFTAASKSGLKFETNVIDGEIEILTRQKFVDGKIGGEIKDTKFVKAEIHAKFDESTGDLFIRNMRVDQTGNRIGTELISNVIETAGSNNVKTVSAQLARTNKDVFTYNLERGLTEVQAFAETPLGKSLNNLGFKTFDVKNSYPFPLIKATY